MTKTGSPCLVNFCWAFSYFFKVSAYRIWSPSGMLWCASGVLHLHTDVGCQFYFFLLCFSVHLHHGHHLLLISGRISAYLVLPWFHGFFFLTNPHVSFHSLWSSCELCYFFRFLNHTDSKRSLVNSHNPISVQSSRRNWSKWNWVRCSTLDLDLQYPPGLRFAWGSLLLTVYSNCPSSNWLKVGSSSLADTWCACWTALSFSLVSGDLPYEVPPLCQHFL